MDHKIILLRHGLSTGNEKGIIQGQKDYPLAEEGIEQSRSLSHYWKDHGFSFDVIIASPLLRAKQTAEIIASSMKLPIEFDKAWCERQSGKAEGKPFTEVKLHYADQPNDTAYDPIFDSGESRWDLFIRAANAMQHLLRRPAGSYLVVSHGAILGAALHTVLGISPSPGRVRPMRLGFANTGYAVLTFDATEARWELRHLNVTCHLQRRFG
ncbi:MAG: histidine phosphatase family protein [Anaerolineales bacterium]|nr:MAG: histidine phosphatase family protein [Anaerolineales bacterium]